MLLYEFLNYELLIGRNEIKKLKQEKKSQGEKNEERGETQQYHEGI